MALAGNLQRALWIAAVITTVLVAGSFWLLRRSGDDPPALSARVFARLKERPEPARIAGPPAVASINELLPRLEAKVAANPGDTGARLLLAQAYGETGQRERALDTIAVLRRAEPRNAQAILVEATVRLLGDGADLQRAFDLLDKAARLEPALAATARLYQGRVRERLGQVPAALEIWRREAGRLAADDSRRAQFEAEIARVTAARGRP